MRRSRMRVKLTDGQLRRATLFGGSQVVTALEVKRVYEKLRKRSYRNLDRRPMYGGTWNVEDHEAYVEGVRDALKELTR